jgi:hypothetical protein
MHFVASYPDSAKAERIAKREGWREGMDGMLDYIDGFDYESHKTFGSLSEAVAWVQQAIVNGPAMFGSGTVDEIEQVRFGHGRCKYCVCGGNKTTKHHIIEEGGIVDTTNETDCLDDDD